MRSETSLLAVAFVAVVGLAAFREPRRIDHVDQAPAQPYAPGHKPTGGTTRIAGAGPVPLAVAISQATYAATNRHDRPSAVLLVREDDALSAAVAAPLRANPFDAAMLFVKADGSIPDATRFELGRLRPSGVLQDANAQVYVAGRMDPAVVERVRRLGLRVRPLRAESAPELAALVLERLVAVRRARPEVVVIASAEDPTHTAVASSVAARQGLPVLLVSKKGVPDATRRALASLGRPKLLALLPRRFPGEVLEELTGFGQVRVIAGESAADLAGAWATTREPSAVRPGWFVTRSRTMGGGAGHLGSPVILVGSRDWRDIVLTSGVLPGQTDAMLALAEPDGSLGDMAYWLLSERQPIPTHPSEQLSSHAWIVGWGVGSEAQREASALLEVTTARSTAPEPEDRAGTGAPSE